MVTTIPYLNDEYEFTGETWNPVVGCTKCSPGCLNCWAEELHDMRREAYLLGKKVPKQYAKPFYEIQLLEKRLEIPLHWRKPRKILTCSMGDWMHPEVPCGFIDKMRQTMLQTPQHTYMTLTKRIKRLYEYCEEKQRGTWPDNIWPGVTICNQPEMWKARMLLGIPAAHKFISFEPLLSGISPSEITYFMKEKGGIRQIIIGCESGPKRRPIARKHIKDLYEQCKAAGVDVMVKQMEIDGKVCKDPARCEEALKNK